MTLKHAFLGVMAASLLAFACDVDRSGSDPAGYYFTGVVYNGETGAKLEEYTVTLTQAGEADLVAKADDNGAYMVGPLKPGSDFVVTIDAGDEYRPFFDVQAMKNSLPNTSDDQQTQYYEAYVFPTGLESPAVTFEVFGIDNANARPNGKIRLAPAGDGTSVLNLGGGTATLGAQAASVSGQYWNNDADRKAGVISDLELADGIVEVKKGALVYGVTYAATIYDVDGHAYKSFAFTAGLTGHQTVNLADLLIGTDTLELQSSSSDTGLASEDGTVSFTFNYPIEFGAATPEDVAKEAIDDNIATQATDLDGDACNLINTLFATDPVTYADYNEDNRNDQERGTSIEISGNTLTLSWNGRNDAFETITGAEECNTGDLTSVTYNLLVAGVTIRPAGATSNANAVTLASLVGNTVTVQLQDPQPN